MRLKNKQKCSVCIFSYMHNPIHALSCESISPHTSVETMTILPDTNLIFSN